MTTMESLVSLPSTTYSNPVVFPPPPPTTNSLTPEQRTKLRKSTKKLGQILGATPQLLDVDIVSILGPVHIQLPPRNEAPSPVLSESSVDSYFSRSSSSCSLYPAHPYAAACSTLEPKPSTSFKSRQGTLRLKSSSGRVANGFERPDTPVLRLAVSPPSPTYSSESSSSAPSTPSDTTSARFSFFDFHSRSNSLDDNSSTTSSLSDMKFTLFPTRHSTSVKPDGSISEHPSTEPSPSSLRRKKMDRLRRVLGDEVPVHLVFPDQKGSDTEFVKGSETDEHASSRLAPVAVAGTAIPRPRKSSMNKIIGARDSMGTMTPHRAKRQDKQKGEKALSPTPPPSPPIVIPASYIPKDPSQKQLCVIVESPEEHGTSSFEGFGFGGSASKKSSLLVQSSWHIRGGTNSKSSGKEDENKVWSTRKGYTGWDRSMVAGKSEKERKRTMSYRKPPPPC